MLKLCWRDLEPCVVEILEELTARVQAETHFASRVKVARQEWRAKTSTRRKADAFNKIRATLSGMCIGPRRCSYCEDSLADEIEHIKPKEFFPDLAFVWSNYLLACGPCNGPKGSRYGVVVDGRVFEVKRTKADTPQPPSAGDDALINPREEDPLHYLELDLGGVNATGDWFPATFNVMPRYGISALDLARANFTIDVLGLNRDVIREARRNAFSGFRARLSEYADEKRGNGCVERLNLIRDELLSTPHLTVFAEMRRQRHFLPDVDRFLNTAPEAVEWSLQPD